MCVGRALVDSEDTRGEYSSLARVGGRVHCFRRRDLARRHLLGKIGPLTLQPVHPFDRTQVGSAGLRFDGVSFDTLVSSANLPPSVRGRAAATPNRARLATSRSRCHRASHSPDLAAQEFQIRYGWSGVRSRRCHDSRGVSHQSVHELWTDWCRSRRRRPRFTVLQRPNETLPG